MPEQPFPARRPSHFPATRQPEASHRGRRRPPAGRLAGLLALSLSGLLLACELPSELEQAPSATSMQVEPAAADGFTGDTVRFSATPVDADGEPTSGYQVSWSSDDTAIATVDDNGLVTFGDSGSTTLTVIASNSDDDTQVQGKGKAKSKGGKAEAVSISPSEATVEEGQTVGLEAIVTDPDGNELDKTVRWTSLDTSVAVVDDSGTITGRSTGTAGIEAKSGSARDTATVEVTASSAEVADVTVDPDSAATAVGDTARLDATVTDSSGSELAYTVAWSSSDTTVATVSDGGVVTGRAAGTALVRAEAGSEADTAEVVVDDTTSTTDPDGDATVSNLSPSAYQLDTLEAGTEFYVDRTYTLQDVPADYQGWTLIRTANDDKNSTADTAITFELSDSATVAVAYDERTTTLPSWMDGWTATGDQLITTDTEYDVYTRALGPGTVVLGGNLSGGAAGAESMYVPAVGAAVDSSADDGSGSDSVASVTVSPDSAALESIGATTQFSAEARAADGTTLSGVSFSWTSSNTAVATVDTDGLATAQGEGATQIIASADGVADSAALSVDTVVTVSSVTVSPDSTALESIGATTQFSAEARAADGTTLSGVSFSWSSSNTAVATVDTDGLATAQGEGSALIVATADGVADSADLTVDTASSDGGSEGVVLPSEGDWSAQGTVLTPGSSGAWDERFPHGTPGPVIEKNGTYYLYYVGADGDRSSDGGPAHRAVGVATSSDLTSWTKSSSDPVIPWSELNQNGDEEEGAWRLAGTVDDDGTILLYVTVLDGSGGSVNGSIHLFTSSDGVNFTDQGVVVDHADSTFPGNDENGVLGAWKGDDGTYHLYYAAKGGLSPDWQLALASGPARGNFTAGESVSSSNTFGHGTDPIILSDTDLAVFMGDNNGDFWAYTPSRSDPANLGAKQESYTGLSSDQFAIYLDRDAGTWYGFFTTGTQGDSDGIDLYTAPAQP